MESQLGSGWRFFTNMAMRLAILYPKRKAELGLDDWAWEGMKQQMESKRGSEWWVFSIEAMNLFLLSADEVYVTDQGLKLINRDKLEQTPGLPDRKIA